MNNEPLMILVAGPYRSGTNDDPALIAANMRAMNEAALRLFHAGHLPITGEALAFPLLEVGGSKHIGDDVFNEIMHPIGRAVVVRCDACLRIGGPSQGGRRDGCAGEGAWAAGVLSSGGCTRCTRSE